MATILDNSFRSDSIDQRLARLQAIEDNHATITPLLPHLKADIAAWMQTCFSRYSSKRSSAGVSSNMRKSGIQDKNLALRHLREQLLLAKEHVEANYTDMPTRRDDYGLAQSLPHAANSLLELADNVLEVHAAHKAQALSGVMSDEQVANLLAAKDALHDALQTTVDRKSGKDSAYDFVHDLFAQDSAMLDRLLAAWHQALGYEDARISLVGMANVQRGGNPGRPGMPTLHVDTAALRLSISPDALHPPATSYQVQYRDTNESAEWVELSNGSATVIALTNPPFGTGNGGIELRARARNANGYSDWSAILGGL